MGPREKGVGVGAETEKRDVTEVEQPREADDDVETEREKRVDEDEEAVVVDGRFAERKEWQEDRRREQRQLPGGRQSSPEPLDPAAQPTAVAALVGLRDPAVDADLGVRRGGLIGIRWGRVGHPPRPSVVPGCRAGRSAGAASPRSGFRTRPG